MSSKDWRVERASSEPNDGYVVRDGAGAPLTLTLSKADASLIATAPAMFAALRYATRIVSYAYQMYLEYGLSGRAEHTKRLQFHISDLVAKARGRT